MKVIVKIKKDSIKKNPNAGQDTYHMPMAWETTFTTNLKPPDLPSWLQEYVREWSLGETSSIDTKGIIGIVDDRFIDYAKSVIESGNRFSIESHRDIQTIRSMTPEPEYHYEYENPKVNCSHCNAMVKVNDISEDEFDGDHLFQICPECGTLDTFDFEYEKFTYGKNL